MGYVIVSVLAFALGILVTLLCTYVRKIRSEEKNNK